MTIPTKAFGITTVIALAAYVATLAPTVTLEYSGSLVAAADTLGVANPPGYPLWTMVAWLFCRVFSFVTYHGHPNPAWAVGLMSAVFASLTCGVVSWLVAKLREQLLPAVAAGLLLAASPALWRYAVIADVHTFHLFFTALFFVSAVLYVQTGTSRWLFAMAACCAAFWLNIQHNFALALLFPFVVALRDRKLALSLLGVIGAATLAYVAAYRFHLATAGAMDACVVAGLLTAALLPKRRLLLAMTGSFITAHLPWIYLPLASAANPPVDWGVPSTWWGFLFMVERGSYESPDWFACFRDPSRMLEHLSGTGRTALLQLGLPAVLCALASLLALRRREGRAAVLPLGFAVLLCSIAIPLFGYMSWDVQQETWVVWLWLPFLLLLAMLAGLGLAELSSRLPRRAGLAFAVVGSLLLLAPPLYRGFLDKNFITIWGSNRQRGHDFGWQFGAYILDGARAIDADLRPGETRPDPAYPPPMEPDAIYFGGTDPGRFVAEYMVFSANFRPDVRVITQNALANNLYTLYLRRYHGDHIWIPSQEDTNLAFQRFVTDVQSGKIPAVGGASNETGHLEVQGVGGVMVINGMIARDIFEKNKAKHAFYLEESYVIPWMYPYLEPNGLIFRLRNEPPPNLPADVVKKDRAFWDWFTARLLANPKFGVDYDARKTFSKLRSANAGLYVARRMFEEAEHGFKQAIALYPLSPEANFRLADTYLQQLRFADAERVIEDFLRHDPRNDKVTAFLEQIRGLKKTDERRRELEAMLSRDGDLNKAMELLTVYRAMNMTERLDSLADTLAGRPGVPDRYLKQISARYAEMGRPDRQEKIERIRKERRKAYP